MTRAPVLQRRKSFLGRISLFVVVTMLVMTPLTAWAASTGAKSYSGSVSSITSTGTKDTTASGHISSGFRHPSPSLSDKMSGKSDTSVAYAPTLSHGHFWTGFGSGLLTGGLLGSLFHPFGFGHVGGSFTRSDGGLDFTLWL